MSKEVSCGYYRDELTLVFVVTVMTILSRALGTMSAHRSKLEKMQTDLRAGVRLWKRFIMNIVLFRLSTHQIGNSGNTCACKLAKELVAIPGNIKALISLAVQC